MKVDVKVKFFRNAREIYGDGNTSRAEEGLVPSTAFSVGVDLRACLDPESALEVAIPPGERFAAGSGIAIEPSLSSCGAGVAGFVYSRSGLGAKHGLTVAQGVGVIDPDYRGEIIVWLLNTSSKTIVLRQGDRMAQLVFLSYYQPVFGITHELGATTRGAGGFGHTGK